VFGTSGLRDQLPHADLLIVGEGSLDAQSLRGKGPTALAALARNTAGGIVAVSGLCTLAPEQLQQSGINAAYELSDLEPDPELRMNEAPRILKAAAMHIARDWLPADVAESPSD
jgi:glycerate 2-kinase